MLNSLGQYYPIEAKPKHSGYLARNQHQVFYEEYGNPEGQPVLVVHGGPGAPVDTNAQMFFDPNFYRIIFIHQRGAGKSKYDAGNFLIENTTPAAISDMEHLRSHLDIDKWTIFGGSWGAVLSILYAEQYPAHCHALILRGMPNPTREEAFSKLPRAGKDFPEQWEKIQNLLTTEELLNFEETCHQRLLNNHDKELAVELIVLNTLSCLPTAPTQMLDFIRSQPEMCLSFTQIFTHYALNEFFLDNPLAPLNKAAEKLNDTQIKITLIHGEQDMNCLPERTCIPFAKQVQHATLKLVTEAGHFNEGNLRDVSLETVESLKEDLIRAAVLQKQPAQLYNQYPQDQKQPVMVISQHRDNSEHKLNSRPNI